MSEMGDPGSPSPDVHGALASPPNDIESVDAHVLEAVFGAAGEQMRSYAALLAGQGQEWGLIGPHEMDRLWGRHLFNSVAPADLIPIGTSVIDVGAGAGMPGIPLALARPDLVVTLLEPLERRCEFLNIAINELGLAERVSVVRGRSEDHHARYDVVTSRAVAPLPRLIKTQWHLRSPSGVLLAIKGASAPNEVAKSRVELAKRRAHVEVLQVRAHPEVEPTTVVRVRAL